jgi:hypothetical protein
MLKHLTVILFTFIIYFQFFNLHAQKFKVITTSIEDINNKLVIKYDFSKSSPAQLYKIVLEITTSDGNIVPVKSLSGDIGINISPGIGKTIIWDYLADQIIMQADINIKVIALLIPEKASISKVLLLSTVCPGIGLYKLNKAEKQKMLINDNNIKFRSKPYWLVGFAGYGALAGSYYFNRKAVESYNKYKENITLSSNEQLFNDSQSNKQKSKIMAYTAIGIWSTNLIWTALKAKKNKFKNKNLMDVQAIVFQTGYNPIYRTTEFTLKINF